MRRRFAWWVLRLAYSRARRHLDKADQLRDMIGLPGQLGDYRLAQAELHERLADFWYALVGDEDARAEVWNRGA